MKKIGICNSTHNENHQMRSPYTGVLATATYLMLGLAGIPRPALAADFTIGAGSHSCTEWLAAGREGSTDGQNRRDVMSQWTLGFLSGVNAQRASRMDKRKLFSRLPDTKAANAYLNGYCRGNPRKDILGATIDMIPDLPLRPLTSRGTIEMEGVGAITCGQYLDYRRPGHRLGAISVIALSWLKGYFMGVALEEPLTLKPDEVPLKNMTLTDVRSRADEMCALSGDKNFFAVATMIEMTLRLEAKHPNGLHPANATAIK